MRKQDSTRGFIIGAVIVVIIIVIAVINVNKKEELDYSQMTEEEIAITVQNKIDQITVSNLEGMGERDRMEYYVKKFVDAVENKQYEEAYKMLYKEFRDNYFPTLESFQEYAKKKFPSEIALKHTNFERNGDIYILWVTLSNPLGSKNSGIEMNFIVKENSLNDFVMSFTVI